MARKRKLADEEILECLEKFDEMSEVEDSASEDETDNDYEANDANESEQSAGESDGDDSEEYIGKDGYVWSTEPRKARRTPQRNIVIGKPGPKNAAIQATTPEEAFRIFINDDIITIVTKWTNQKIKLVRDTFKFRQGYSYDITNKETQAFIGVLIFLGATKSSMEAISSIWAQDGTGKPLCISAMSQKRFTFISYCLRFDDKLNREERKKNDKLAPIREIFDMFVNACHSNYTPGPECTVDESLLSFRGRCGFKQYIPNKPSKYGIKLFVLADNDTSYSVKSIVYIGAGTFTDMANLDVPVPTKAVLGLVDCIEGTNRNITTDNYYTSIALARELRSRKLTLVGTLKKNKTCIPPCFLTKSDAGTVHYGFDKQNNYTLLSVTPKKNKKVVFLSSMHQTKQSDCNREEINMYYNKTKGGVDSHDQKCSLFTTARRTNRWPMRLFYGILDCSIVNAFVIMSANVPAFAANNKKDKRTYFMKSVARALIEPYAKQRLCAIQTPKQVRQIIESCGIKHEGHAAEERDVNSADTPTQTGLKARCARCPRKSDRKTKTVCVVCKTHVCTSHSVTLCTVCYPKV